MTYKLGLKLLKRLCEEQQPLAWTNAKLSKALFKGEEEQAAFGYVAEHMQHYHALPQLETLAQQFPECAEFTTPEPAKYYLDLLDRRYAYDLINHTNIESQALLKTNKDDTATALQLMKSCVDKITMQQYRTKILNMGAEGPKLVLEDYHHVNDIDHSITLGWPYLDTMSGGLAPGDVVSIVGRPAAGKTFLGLNIALHNWQATHPGMFVSMEMNPLAIAKRLTAMYAKTNLSQLLVGGYSTPTYKQFASSLISMAQQQAPLYVVDGNLAASVEDIYTLALQLHCKYVVIDGAYLLRHPNPKLNRFEKVAVNTELIKQATTEFPTICSWQFSRDAVKLKNKEEKIGLHHIGMSDTIPQVSSMVLGLMQDDSVETLERRLVDVMKGRNGQTGQFHIHWNFNTMDFGEVIDDAELDEKPELDYL